MTRAQLKQLIREVIEEVQPQQKTIDGYPELVHILFVRGMRDDMTDDEFTKQVVDNVHEWSRTTFPNDPARAKKQARYKLGYDEDFWGDAYEYFREKFGHEPKK